MSATPPSLVDVRSVLTQMLGSASEQVRQSSYLVQMVRELPPSPGAMKSRVRFDRAALMSLCANFFNLRENVPASKNIRVPEDCWVRGVSAVVLPSVSFDQVPDAAAWYAATQMRALLTRYGTNWRGLVEVDWRIPAQQGFIQDGQADVMAPAAQVTGDGEFSVDLDWRLNREDTIVVRATNRLNRTLDAECDSAIVREFPWVAVVFWAEPRE